MLYLYPAMGHAPEVSFTQAGPCLVCKTKTLQIPSCHTRPQRPLLSSACTCSHANLAPCNKDLMGTISLLASSWETKQKAGSSHASTPSPAHKVGTWDLAWESTSLHCLFLSCRQIHGAAAPQRSEAKVATCTQLHLPPEQHRAGREWWVCTWVPLQPFGPGYLFILQISNEVFLKGKILWLPA